MNITHQEACIFHLFNIRPSETVRFTNHWDLATALEYHQSLASGNAREQAAAQALSVCQVYEALQEYLTKPSSYADEDVMGAYIMDSATWSKMFQYLREEREVVTV